jgi:hypothetical protein
MIKFMSPTIFGVQQGLNFGGVKWAFTSFELQFWHPLTWISHLLDWHLYGSNAGGHHLTNVIFHILSSVLLFLWLNRVTRASWRSAFVAGLFALHPLRVESVAWRFTASSIFPRVSSVRCISFHLKKTPGANAGFDFSTSFPVERALPNFFRESIHG